jgi:hypothetical protein
MKKQQEHWQKTIPSLNTMMLRRCKEHTGKSSKALYDLVQLFIGANCEEGTFFYTAFKLFIQRLEHHKLAQKQITEALITFFQIPEVQMALTDLQKTILLQFRQQEEASLKASTAALLSSPKKPEIPVIPVDPKSLQTSIEALVDSAYSLADERISSCEQRKLRRLDSLARLLAPQLSKSPCVAVTLDTSSTPPRLVISSNIANEGEQDSLANEILLKLQIIQRGITDITKIEHILSEEGITRAAEALIEELKRRTSFAGTESTLKQAAIKLIKTICYDRKTLTTPEKDAFLNPEPLMLLPIHEREYYMDARTYSAGGTSFTSHRFLLDKVPLETKISDIHAEQLIARYFFEELKTTEQRMIGISRLCCKICYENLKTYPIIVRGSHAQSYKGVIDLRTGAQATDEPTRRAVTYAWPSPPITPTSGEVDEAFSLLPASPVGVASLSSPTIRAMKTEAISYPHSTKDRFTFFGRADTPLPAITIDAKGSGTIVLEKKDTIISHAAEAHIRATEKR